jgi:DNA invertase Pin-like site-specific DNA recombinase
VLDFIGKGDVLLVTRVDRLARSIGDLQDIVRTLKAKGASLRATEQPIDTSTAAGKCFLDMLGVFAEFETGGNTRSIPTSTAQIAAILRFAMQAMSIISTTATCIMFMTIMSMSM